MCKRTSACSATISTKTAKPPPGVWQDREASTATVAANANINNASQMKSVYWGPSLGANKSFLKKTLRTGVNTAYNQSHLNGKSDAPILTTGLNASWSPAGKDGKNPHHSLHFNTSWIQRFKSKTRPAQRELTATLTYGYKF